MTIGYKEFFIKNNHVGEFFLRCWLPEKNSNVFIIILHGLGGNSLYYNKIGTYLAKDGIKVYAYDRRGHGKSFGKKGDIDSGHTDINDLFFIINHLLKSNEHNNLYLVGESWGCLIALQYLSIYNKDVSGLIMLSPPISLSINRKWIKPILTSLAHFLISGKIGPVFPLEDASNSKEFYNLLESDNNVNYYFPMNYGIKTIKVFTNSLKHAKRSKVAYINYKWYW